MSTIIISTMLAAIVAVVIFSMRKDKKKGKSSCGCSCSGCPMSGKCHSVNTTTVKHTVLERS